MPNRYSAETLPKPTSKEVLLVPTEARRMAVIRFSGIANDERIEQHKKLLEAYILAEKLKPIGGTTLAFNNPPWTLPFLRRNEVMIEIGIDP